MYFYSATLAVSQLQPQGWKTVVHLKFFSWLDSQKNGNFCVAAKRSFRLWSHSIKVCPCGTPSVLTFHHCQRQRSSVSTAEIASHAPQIQTMPLHQELQGGQIINCSWTSRSLSPAARQPCCKTTSWLINYSELQKLERQARMKREEKSKVKLHAGNVSIHRRQRKHMCPAHGHTAVQTPACSAGLKLPICFTKDCNSHRMTATFLSTIPSQIQTTEVQMKRAGLSL